jgi:hypothetical protein
MWYLGLTLVAVLCLAAYTTYGLGRGPFDSLAVWDQRLVSAWWSTGWVIDWTGRLWGAGAEPGIALEWPPAPAPMMLVATAGAILHLPGVTAYSFILRRAGYVDDGWRGFAVGIGVGTALVVGTAALAMWLGGMAFMMLR